MAANVLVIYRRKNGASCKKIPWSQIGLLAALAFAWTKLGLGEAIKEVGAVIQPDQVAGVVRPVKRALPCRMGKNRKPVR